jgi:hypothetical protein
MPSVGSAVPHGGHSSAAGLQAATATGSGRTSTVSATSKMYIAVGFMADWLALLEQTIQQAQAEGDVDPEIDPAQLAFEIEANLLLSNALFAMTAEPTPIERARRALERRFDEVTPAPAR